MRLVRLAVQEWQGMDMANGNEPTTNRVGSITVCLPVTKVSWRGVMPAEIDANKSGTVT
jgi:hypothetical protein